MSDRQELPDEVKTFIVQQLACWDAPSVVATAVKEEFGIDISRQAVQAYDPTKRAGRDLSERWTVLFNETRKTFLEETAGIGIANRTVRLRRLDRMATAAETLGNLALAATFGELAAKEMGGAFTNEHKLEHSGKVSTGPQTLTLMTTDPVEAAKAYRQMMGR